VKTQQMHKLQHALNEEREKKKERRGWLEPVTHTLVKGKKELADSNPHSSTIVAP